MSILYLVPLRSRDGQYQVPVLPLFFPTVLLQHSLSCWAWTQPQNLFEHTAPGSPCQLTQTKSAFLLWLFPLGPTLYNICWHFVFAFDWILVFMVLALFHVCIHCLLQVLGLCLILISEHQLQWLAYSRHTRCSQHTRDTWMIFMKKIQSKQQQQTFPLFLIIV